MHAALIREFFQQHSIFLHEFYDFIIIMSCHGIFRQNIEFFFRQTKSFPHFPKNGAVLKLDIRSTKSHIFFSVSFKNIRQNFIAFAPTPVDIKIGRIISVFIQKTLKIKIEFDGTDFCNSEQITHNAVCATSTTNMQKTTTVAVFHNIQSNQKIACKIHFRDDFQFFFNTVDDDLVFFRISFLQTIIREFS